MDIYTELDAARQGEKLSCRDLVSIDQLSLPDIELIMRVAGVFKEFLAEGKGHKKTDVLKGTSMFNFFNENSTRTRSSFELAGKHLGSDVINISGSASSTKKGETIGDTARTLDAYAADLIVVRDSHAGIPEQLSRLVGAPVVNAGDGRHEHPTQALLNLFTLREKFGDKKLRYLWVGDVKYSRVFGSEVRLYKKLGWDLRVCSFETLLPEQVEQWGVTVYHECEAAALQDVDAMIALRLQTERAAGKEIPTPREYSKNYMINTRRVGLARPDVAVLHAGPVVREFDIGSEVLEGPHSLVQAMVTNGLVVRMAVLYLLVHHAGGVKVRGW